MDFNPNPKCASSNSILHPTICLIGGVTPTPFLAVGDRMSGGVGSKLSNCDKNVISSPIDFQVMIMTKLGTDIGHGPTSTLVVFGESRSKVKVKVTEKPKFLFSQ